MLTLPRGARLLLATDRVDGRKGINANSLAATPGYLAAESLSTPLPAAKAPLPIPLPTLRRFSTRRERPRSASVSRSRLCRAGLFVVLAQESARAGRCWNSAAV